MHSEQPISWRRHVVFDPMDAHSQADDATLTYVMQFNADEREHQERRLQKLARSIQHLPRAQRGR